jgi:hypothetical protein
MRKEQCEALGCYKCAVNNSYLKSEVCVRNRYVEQSCSCGCHNTVTSESLRLPYNYNPYGTYGGQMYMGEPVSYRNQPPNGDNM